jgi:hypothetical protein
MYKSVLVHADVDKGAESGRYAPFQRIRLMLIPYDAAC